MRCGHEVTRSRWVGDSCRLGVAKLLRPPRVPDITLIAFGAGRVITRLPAARVAFFVLVFHCSAEAYDATLVPESQIDCGSLKPCDLDSASRALYGRDSAEAEVLDLDELLDAVLRPFAAESRLLHATKRSDLS